jgi:hypothetical protein
MDTSTLRSAAETVAERATELVQTVADVAPDVSHKVGDTALRLAALTPWVEEAAASRRSQRWIVAIALIIVGAALATWWTKRNRASEPQADIASTSAATTRDRRLASAGS